MKRECSLPYHRVHWPRKGNVERLFLEHALLVADVMVAVELACRRRTDVRFLTTDELPLPLNSTTRRDPFQWKVELGRGRICGVIPDRVFGLEFSDRPPGQNQLWFCLEADRGTMPVTRAHLEQTSVYRKLLAYEATWKQKLHRKLFDQSRFRVLTVTTNAERLAAMLSACSSLKSGRGLFLFAHVNSLRAQSPLSEIWKTANSAQPISPLD